MPCHAVSFGPNLHTLALHQIHSAHWIPRAIRRILRGRMGIIAQTQLDISANYSDDEQHNPPISLYRNSRSAA